MAKILPLYTKTPKILSKFRQKWPKLGQNEKIRNFEIFAIFHTGVIFLYQILAIFDKYST
jgi:hypothetical protein